MNDRAEFLARRRKGLGGSNSLRVCIRGLQIHAKALEGGVVHLGIGREQQHKTLWRRIRQHLAHALFRAGDCLNPPHQDQTTRVVEPVVGSTAGNDGLAHVRGSHALHIAALDSPDRQSHHERLVIYEGVKGREYGLDTLGKLVVVSPEEGADDAHWLPLTGLNDRHVLIVPDDGTPNPESI